MPEQRRDLITALALFGAALAVLIVVGLVFNLPTLL